MDIPSDNGEILQSYIREGLQMLDEAKLHVGLLVRADAEPQDVRAAMEYCRTFFHSMKETGAYLQLDNLTDVAAAAESLLMQLLTGSIGFAQDKFLLLQEACSFFKQGLSHVRDNNNDEHLAQIAQSLASRLSLAVEGEDDLTRLSEDDSISSDMVSQSFVAEVDELLQLIERELLLWDLVAVDPDRLSQLTDYLFQARELFSAGDFVDLERLCRSMATTLRRFQDGEVFQGEYPEKIFLQLVDVLYEGIDNIVAGGDGMVINIEHHLQSLQSIMRQPIGELLVKAGLVDPQTMEEALRIQQEARAREKTPQRLGELLVAMGEVTPDQVELALQEQTEKITTKGSGTDSVEKAGRSAENKDQDFAAGTIRVDAERFNHLLQLIGRLDIRRGELPAAMQTLVTELVETATCLVEANDTL